MVFLLHCLQEAVDQCLWLDACTIGRFNSGLDIAFGFLCLSIAPILLEQLVSLLHSTDFMPIDSDSQIDHPFAVSSNSDTVKAVIAHLAQLDGRQVRVIGQGHRKSFDGLVCCGKAENLFSAGILL